MKQNSIFEDVSVRIQKRNRFDLSHDRKQSMQMGRLYPCLNYDVGSPGTTVDLLGKNLIRLQPLVSPMMHTVNAFTHYWFTPYRILWPNWETGITGGKRADTVQPEWPYVIVPEGGFDVGSIPDYLGLPTGVAGGQRICALRFAAYHRIVVEHYRAENVQDTEPLVLVDGDNTAAVVAAGLFGVPFARNWEHDYFTSCLPEPQKGAPVTIPVGVTAPLLFQNSTLPLNTQNAVKAGSGEPGVAATAGGVDVTGGATLQSNAADIFNIDMSKTHIVDLSEAIGITVNEFRYTMALQRVLERAMLGGSRFSEYLKSTFGVDYSDKTLQRPQYLGGGKQQISVSEVLQTSETDGTAQGNMAGHGISLGDVSRFSHFFEEQGCVLGFMSVMPKTAYSQGLHPSWKRFDRLDWYNPLFNGIGEQPVKVEELWWTDNPSVNDKTFGYLPYMTSMRYISDSIHGQFRTTLRHWHMGRVFSAEPVLNDSFMLCDPSREVFAILDPTVDSLLCHFYQAIEARIPLALYGTPV